MTGQIFQGIKNGITPADIERALTNGGDISFLKPLLAQALNSPPVEIAATLETPQLLPETNALIPGGAKALSRLVALWGKGEGYRGESLANIGLTLLPLPPDGQNVAAYLEAAIKEVDPEILALDASDGELSATLRYTLSLPAAAGATAFAEIRLKEDGKPYGNRVFYPGGRDEIAILAAMLGRRPLLPVGKPYPAGDAALKKSDADVEDEDSSGLHIQDAYLALDEFLENKPYLSLLAEQAARTGATLENSVSPHINHKLIREAKYAASRLLDLAYFVNDPAQKTRILAVLDMKHYPAVARSIELILRGHNEDNYVLPGEDGKAPLMMLGRHSFAAPPDGGHPEKTGVAGLFTRSLAAWSGAKAREKLDAAAVDNYIALIMERVRTHPLVARGGSVRGSLGLKEVTLSLAQLDTGINRDKIEKAALITLPARLRLKPGTKLSREAVVSETVKEVLYGIEFYRTSYKIADEGGNDWLSPEEINRLLESLGQEKKPGQDGSQTGDKEKDDKLLKALEAQKLLRRGAGGGFILTSRSLERLLEDLERRRLTGKMAPADYNREKARLTAMLSAARAGEHAISPREVAGMVLDFMDVVDTGFGREWGREIGFLRMFMYYRMKVESGVLLPPWQTDWTVLKERLDALEKRGILKTSPQGERTVSGLGLALLLEYIQPRNQELKNLRESIIQQKTLLPTRNEGIRPFTAVNTYRDISFRHTLKEVAKQRKELENVRKSDFRVFMKPRQRLGTDIVICLDTSGSMAEHRKLVYARLAAAAIAAAARENGDRTAVVSFEDAGRTSIPLSDESNDLVNDYLAALVAIGATNIGDGVKCAVDLLTRDTNHNKKRIFLITDGEPNAISEKALKSLKDKTGGPADLTEEAALVETRRAAARGLTVSVIYLAAELMKGYNFAKNIARAGKGRVIMLGGRAEGPFLGEEPPEYVQYQEYH
jgi:Mg-chelatase subunit ChlD